MSRTRSEYEAVVAKLREAGLDVSETSQPYQGGTLTATTYMFPYDAPREELHRLLDVALDAGADFTKYQGLSGDISVRVTEHTCCRCGGEP